MIKIAIDAMGGDYAPQTIVEGVNKSIAKNDDLELVLYGVPEEINKYLIPNDRVSIVSALSKLDMGEKNPILAIRRDKELSLSKAFRAVHDKECDGVVTAGPTQGVVVAAHMIIKKIPGMDRIALCPTLPKMGTKTKLLLDVGANVELKAEHVTEMAKFASVYADLVLGRENPLVGLVNIGSEPGKGRVQEKEAYKMLSECKDINFYGNIEPKEMLLSDCDILVASDGFSGNLVLKSIEGTAKAMSSVMKEEIKASLSGKIGYLFMRKNLRNLKNRMSGDDVGGALIFGVDGVVVKAHGASNAYATSKAIDLCYKAVKSQFLEKIKKGLNNES